MGFARRRAAFLRKGGRWAAAGDSGRNILVCRDWQTRSMFDIIRHQIHLCIFTYAAVWTGGEVQLSKEHDGFLWLHKDEVEESELPHWMKRDIFRALEAVENH